MEDHEPEKDTLLENFISKPPFVAYFDWRLVNLKCVGGPGSKALPSSRQLPISGMYLKQGRYLKSALDMLGGLSLHRSWQMSGSPRAAQHGLWSRVSVRQVNMGVAQGAQVTMSLRDTEGRAAGSQNIWTHLVLVTLLAMHHPIVSCHGLETPWRPRARE